MVRKPPTFLRLVEPIPALPAVNTEDFKPSEWQSTLFAQDNPALLIFVDFVDISESDFLTILTSAKPKFMIDLRLAPRFDIGAINRKLVFSLFQQLGTNYFDLSGRLGVRSLNDARLNPSLLAEAIQDAVFPKKTLIQGPIVFLVDKNQFQEDYISNLTNGLDSSSDIGWEILLVPNSKPAGKSNYQNRNTIFISHANPEDNDFVIWLSARLVSAGYEVWSDLGKLMGGEEFFDTIEDVIRNSAAKIIAVLSQTAQTKKNFLDEINCAVGVERSQNLENFVIPVRVDGIPFDQVRANLARKNIIDFSKNWADGLSLLLKAFARDQVPKISTPITHTNFLRLDSNQAQSIILSKPELLISNWLPIKQWPGDIVFYEIDAPADKINAIIRELPFPAFRHLRLIGSCAEIFALQEYILSYTLKERARIPFDQFLESGSSDLGIKRREAHNFTTSLIRQAWDKHASARNLKPYETASGSIAWFFPKGLLESDKLTFTDLEGKQRRKNLIGWSKKRQVFWHYGVELKASVGALPHVTVKAHIIFTTDGITPIASKERMHILRRSFCKSWWNDRWRDLLLAFTAWLSEGKETINFAVGVNNIIQIEGLPIKLNCPFSVEEDASEEVSEDVIEAYDFEDEEIDEELEEALDIQALTEDAV